MQWLRRIVPKLLALGALVVVILAAAGDHDSEYGAVPLPQGGVVSLPEGTVQVFVDELSAGGDSPGLASPLAFTITPVGGSGALGIEPAANEGSADQLTRRGESFGGGGALADVEVPSAGDYRVSGAFEESSATATLKFGTDVFAAVRNEWRLWGGLLLAAFLVSLLPVPKARKHADRAGNAAGGEAGGYQPPRYNPYNG